LIGFPNGEEVAMSFETPGTDEPDEGNGTEEGGGEENGGGEEGGGEESA
jgi:hypothetical protein